MNKIYCRKYRVKKTLHNKAVPQDQGVLANVQETNSQNNFEISHFSPIPSTSGTVQTRSSEEKLQVCPPFCTLTSSRSRTSKTKVMVKTRKKRLTLKYRLREEQIVKKRWQKRFERQKKKVTISQTPSKSAQDQTPSTPGKMVRNDLSNASINPDRVSKQIFGKLKASNCLMAEIRSAKWKNNTIQS